MAHRKHPPDLRLNVFAAIALGLLIAGICAWRAWPMAWLWAIACLAAGAAAGFLFGIRTTENRNDKAPGSKPDTNLEEISDWLTKILIGLGLAEISKIPTMLQQAADYVAKGLGVGPGATSIAYGVIVYFSIVGFIGSYLLTRLGLPAALSAAQMRAEQSLIQFGQATGALHQSDGVPVHEEKAISPPQTTGTSGGDGGSLTEKAVDAVEVTGSVLEAYMALEKKAPPTELQTYIHRLEPQKKKFPVYRMLYIILARLYRSIHNYDKAIEILSQFLDHKQKNNTGSDKDAAAAYFNRACYYALQLSARADVKQKAIDDIKEAIRLVPEYKAEARVDPDLESVRKEIMELFPN